MALLRLSMLSQALGTNTEIHMLLPDQAPPPGGYQVLYLLHGYMGDGSDWIRHSMLERYMADTHTIVVMPNGGRSFYTDTLSGDYCWTFLSEELPALVARYFPVSQRREDTYAMGLSMGGYAAIKLGLRHPEQIGHVVSFSGVTDVSQLWDTPIARPDLLANCIVPPSFDTIFGSKEAFVGSANDCLALIRSADPKKCPQLSLYCGTEDALLDMNRNFIQLAQLHGISCTYEEFSGGHEWAFWNVALEKSLKQLPFSP